jgi:hypothetical protein
MQVQAAGEKILLSRNTVPGDGLVIHDQAIPHNDYSAIAPSQEGNQQQNSHSLIRSSRVRRLPDRSQGPDLP